MEEAGQVIGVVSVDSVKPGCLLRMIRSFYPSCKLQVVGRIWHVQLKTKAAQLQSLVNAGSVSR